MSLLHCIAGRQRATTLILLALAAGLLLATTSQAQRLPYECGTLKNEYGPFDYRDPVAYRTKLPIVEQYHFTRQVELLVRGRTTNAVMPDLDYTLRAFPNHHRALFSLVNLAWQYRQQRRPPGAVRNPECYFRRAIAFVPDDGISYAVYGAFLEKFDRLDEAREKFERAVELAPEFPEAHYNFGLLLVKLKDYETALIHAHRAYELGFPLPGLKNQLTRAGVWREPEAKDDEAADGTDGSEESK